MSSDKSEILRSIEAIIDEPIQNIDAFEVALTHRSYVNEVSEEDIRDNERYEFLGDSVLNLTVSDLLMNQYPEVPEGTLSKFRAAIVNEARLAEFARAIEVGKYLRLGKGEEATRGREKDSILADAYEALIAAIYLSNGFQSAFRFVRSQVMDDIYEVHNVKNRTDYKTELQEISQRHFRATPNYRLIEETGPDHKKIFSSEVSIRKRVLGVGSAKSKKDSEQNAAKIAIDVLERELPSEDGEE